MAGLEVLCVCVGNVCRSPLAERLLVARGDGRLTASSAGVRALAGSPMDPLAAAELTARGGTAEGFTARQLAPEMVQRADLVLTATAELRSRVLEEVPTALRRTFALRELAGLLALGDERPGDPAALVSRAAAARSRLPRGDHDVPDPYRRGAEAHAEAAALIEESVSVIVGRLAPTVP